jgi:hypothetical protein
MFSGEEYFEAVRMTTTEILEQEIENFEAIMKVAVADGSLRVVETLLKAIESHRETIRMVKETQLCALHTPSKED